MAKKNTITARVFVDKTSFTRYEKKTPLYVQMLKKFKQIKPDSWTENQLISDFVYGELKKYFRVETI